MNARIAARLAWSLWVLALLFFAAGLYFGVIDAARPSVASSPLSDTGPVFPVAELVLMTVGALVAARRPANPIGWILCGSGLINNLGNFADGYAVRGLLIQPGSLPGAAVMAWVAEWASGPTPLGGVVLVFLLFPDGRPLSPHWRPIVWLAAIITPLLGLIMFQPGPLNDYSFVNNPFGIGGPAGQVVVGVGNLAFYVLLGILAASGLALVRRFRRATGDERQQLKWLASAGAIIIVIFLLGPVIWFTPALNDTPLWPILFLVAFIALPLCLGIAILKYRLYDIDLIIRRTLMYSVLSALLAFVYFGSVVLLQSIVRGLTGQSQAQWVIVVSTLAIAALFNPLRHRLQSLIDRAFYRRKYDAAQVLAAFLARARDEVELGPLLEHLMQAADETVKPEHMSLWLKPRDEIRPGGSLPLQSQASNHHQS